MEEAQGASAGVGEVEGSAIGDMNSEEAICFAGEESIDTRGHERGTFSDDG
jgi:hypothetical protein